MLIQCSFHLFASVKFTVYASKLFIMLEKSVNCILDIVEHEPDQGKIKEQPVKLG